ncbi:hypothetical protein KEM54_000708 [Ascosphaera aggregata]|nr:hypothetical protein KEM54_000708 [Ascosphaera aggregata]
MRLPAIPSLSSFFITLIAVFASLLPLSVAVKHHDFKTCEQSGFCKRNRAYADSVLEKGPSFSSPYRLLSDSISLIDGQLQAIVIKTTNDDQKEVRLPLTISFLQSGVARVTLDEERRMKGDIELRHGSTVRKERYNEAEKWAIVGGLELGKLAKRADSSSKDVTTIRYGPDNAYSAIITHQPLRIEFQRDGDTHVAFNERGFLNLEHWRAQVESQSKSESEDSEKKDTEGQKTLQDDQTENSPDYIAAVDDSTWWDETFGGNTDSKPRGPESVALDITFPGYSHVYGIPEHADSLSLRETRGGEGAHTEPYRMYNSDVFEYELNSPMTLYGSIPLLQAHRKGSTAGVFWLNAAETWVDITKEKSKDKGATHTHWMSESGLLDVFVFLGPTPQAIAKDYGALTGYTQLPQHFAIAYHQCRWNYFTDEDVKDVDRKFDMYEIPYDVIWLDIEYLDEKKYFTWDPLQFPDPISMQEQLDRSDRKLVIIVDPHIKDVGSYDIIKEMKAKDLTMKNKNGDHYDGWCWPGSSKWVDTFNPAAHEWWKSLFSYERYKTALSNCFIWNDMNEPSVFNGPDMTSPRDNIHHGGWEHRDVHNLNGLTFVNATYNAIRERKPGEFRRPFVLTRSFYAGSQRMGAMWTGDNQARWDHLSMSIPMVLTNGIAGFPFAGADIGGFFGNPSKELLTRWYQAGIWYPFMRAHAHIDTRRREPYLAGEPHMSYISQAIRLRYSLLPAWYTTFHEASINGTPLVRPQFFVHPTDEAGFVVDDQFYVGSCGLLVKPVTTEGATSADIYIADGERYYDYFDYTVYEGAGKHHTVDAPLEKVPVLMQGGHIIPRKDRPRRSSGLMRYDPYTLVIVLDKNGKAEGTLYEDDGETYDFKDGAYIHRRFIFDGSKLVSEDIATQGVKTTEYIEATANVNVEKVIVVGAPESWKQMNHVSVLVNGRDQSEAEVTFNAGQGKKAAFAVVKNPKVPVGASWTIDFA